MIENTENKMDLNADYKNIVESVESTNSKDSERVEQGSVNMERFAPDQAQSADFHLGYHSIDVTMLPSAGLFYLPDVVLKIRAAKVSEIRNFSVVDETNLIDMEEKLNYIMKNCVKMEANSKTLSYKDILEEDRFFILLSIRDMTFPEHENRLMSTGKTKDGEEFDVEIATKYFQTATIPENIKKYYSEEDRVFNIKTKSFGVIPMSPPTIGIMEVVTNHIKSKQLKNETWDQSFLQILPYIQMNWRGFNTDSIFKSDIEFQGWDTMKYTLIYRLAEQMRVGIKSEMKVEHEAEEVFVPILFRDGIKSLFVISDISGELL